MNNIKKIEVVFENCEVIDITKAVGDFHIGEINYEIYRIASNSIAKIPMAKTIHFQVYGDGEFVKHNLYGNTNPAKRFLDCNDITSIELTYNNDAKESFYPDYDGEEVNSNQTTKEYKGDIFVVISSDKKFEDIYTEEIMEACTESKSFCMNESTKALNNLKKEGWNVVLKTKDFINICKDNIGINVTDNLTAITLTNPYKNYVIDNNVMYNICSLIFNTCFLNNTIFSKDIKDYKYITFDNDINFDGNENGEVVIPFKFKTHKSWDFTNAVLTFKKESGKDFLEGNLEIEGDLFKVSTFYNIMWIMHDYLPDKFWKRY